MITTYQMHCYVPKTAELLGLFGGPDFDRDIVISIERHLVRRKPGDPFVREIDAPDGPLDGYGMLPLHIARTRSELFSPGSDWISVQFGFRGSCNDDGYWSQLYGFRVPRVGWESGLWTANLWSFEVPFGAAFAVHADSEGSQIQLNRKATCEWEDSENIGLTDALIVAGDCMRNPDPNRQED